MLAGSPTIWSYMVLTAKAAHRLPVETCTFAASCKIAVTLPTLVQFGVRMNPNQQQR